MSYDDHDRCRRCGAIDGPSHAATGCERVRAQRAEVQRTHNAARAQPPDRCGPAGPCAWMGAALLTNDGHAVNFARREMEHPDTFKPVVRYVATVAGERVVKVAACPACGGNPNEETVYR